MNENLFELQNKITDYYKAYLRRKPKKAGLEYFLSRLKVGKISISDIPKILQSTTEYKGLKRLDHGCIYTKYGTKMYLNKNDLVISNFLAREFVLEPEETEILRRKIKSGMVVVDIGANIGYYSVLFSKWVGNTGKVYCFEPDPENFSLLKKNIIANNYHNTNLIQKAVSNSNKEGVLYLSKENIGDHRILNFHYYDRDNEREKIKIQSTKLDSIFSNKKINLIKMDIQGAEMLALDGMKDILQNNSNLMIFTEFWPAGLEAAGFSANDFIEKIKSYGFKIFSIERGNIVKPVVGNFQFCKNYPYDHINFICEKTHL